MKTVLITGAGRGIGLALTSKFATSGFQVIATYRDPLTSNALLTSAKSNPAILPVVADVTNEKSFAPLQECLEKVGTLDILINNSGVIGDRQKSFMQIAMADLEQVFQVNTFAPMKVARLALPFMKNQGVIAQISSLMGSIDDCTSSSYYAYRMSKAALNMFNMCLSREFPNMTCLTLHPGWVQTAMGGPDALISADICAHGLFDVITQAKLSQTGQFLDYTGKRLPW